MLIVTVRSCIEQLRPLGKGFSEIILVDNSDPSIYKMLSQNFPMGYIKDGTIKIFRQTFPCLFTAREKAVLESSGEYISCVDGHMIIGHNMFLDLVNFMDSRQDDQTVGFAHAPVNWAHQHETAARHDRDMTKCELGDWNKSYKVARTITFKGMPWICRKTLWNSIGGYGALAENKLSWGGGDMHIGLKPWLLGFRNWAVPCSPAIHIGPFPKEVGTNPNSVYIRNQGGKVAARDRYRVYSVSGEGPHSLGFLVSCYVLGGESMMKRNKKRIDERFGKFIDVNRYWNQAMQFGEKERRWMLDNQVMTFDQFLKDKPYAS